MILVLHEKFFFICHPVIVPEKPKVKRGSLIASLHEIVDILKNQYYHFRSFRGNIVLL